MQGLWLQVLPQKGLKSIDDKFAMKVSTLTMNGANLQKDSDL